MARIASILIDDSQYDPRFRAILDATGLEPQEFEGLDYYSYLPFFVIAGATITPQLRFHGDHSHFEGAHVDVPDAEVEMFYDALPHVLAMITEGG
ncbi:hypothetical protein [Patulibacter defluvii]|uniref:hypothetical protein n=1 Tax=Patulibacter defluvii TaxID=3095358 RepID=UPI002A755DCC|nr:hypothetical protein [Patulibacter sp. DM4]